MSKKDKANPSGRTGITGGELSYADKKELNHGITLVLIEEEQARSLYKTIEAFPKRKTRFAAIRSIKDVSRGSHE